MDMITARKMNWKDFNTKMDSYIDGYKMVTLGYIDGYTIKGSNTNRYRVFCNCVTGKRL